MTAAPQMNQPEATVDFVFISTLCPILLLTCAVVVLGLMSETGLIDMEILADDAELTPATEFPG
jgi:hypothetical protein